MKNSIKRAQSKLATLAAILCCAVTTTVFTACGDDDTPTSPVAGAYQYWVEFDLTTSYGYYDTEVATLKAALNRAVGLEGSIYKKTYTSNQDTQMKAACEEVIAQYSNVQSLLLTYTLYGNNGEYGKTVKVASLTAGKSLTTPYATILFDSENDTEAMKALRDSLYSLKTAADSATVERLRSKTNDFSTKVVLNVKDAIKDVNEVWNVETDLDRYNEAFFDQIANAIEEPDSLLYSFTILVSKVRLPEVKRSKIWEKTYKAYNKK